MSAFLGPIHHWLFNKIKFQNELANVVFAVAKKEDSNSNLEELTNQQYAMLDQGNLEDIIDEYNIHGWLQERVSLVESRLAFAVTTFLDGNRERFSLLLDEVYAFGKSNAVDEKADVAQIFKHLEDLLLNGMPCDHVNRVLENSSNEVRWEQTVDIHGDYWRSVQGDPNNYGIIRERLIEGMISLSKVEFLHEQDGIFVLRNK